MVFEPKRKVSEEKEIKTKYLPEIEVSEVPSKFISYKEDYIITYRPYAFGEIKKTNQSKMSIRSMFDFILEGITTNFDKYNLTVPDFLYISLLRKISTLGETKFNIKCLCSSCKIENSNTLNIQDIEFRDIKAPKLPINVELSVGKFSFKPLTLKDYYFLIKEKKEDDVLALLAIQACKDNEKEFNKVYQEFYNLNREDGEILEEVDNYLDHSLMPVIFKCKECKEDIKVELEGGQNFIYPFRTNKKSVRDRIYFG